MGREYLHSDQDCHRVRVPYISLMYLCERQRSPSAHLVRRRGATPCSPHSLSFCFPEIIQIIGALAKDIAVVTTRAPTSANPTISSIESNFLFVAVAHRMRETAKTIRNHFLRIATNRRNRGEFLSIFIFSANVTGQRTRHLVAGTLDPLVVRHLFSVLKIAR